MLMMLLIMVLAAADAAADAAAHVDDASVAANAEEEDECVVSKWSTAGPNLQNHGSIVSSGRSSAFCPTFRKER